MTVVTQVTAVPAAFVAVRVKVLVAVTVTGFVPSTGTVPTP